MLLRHVMRQLMAVVMVTERKAARRYRRLASGNERAKSRKQT